jgi:predicted PurR-regulated permease PerM
MNLKSIKPQTPEDLASLVGAVALAIFAVIIVTVLFMGREVFVPVALSILLSFVLAPPVNLLERMRVPRAIAVVGVVLFAFAIIFGLGSLIATQVNRLAGDLPRYQTVEVRQPGLEVSDAKRLKALEDENAKLKRLLAEAMLDNAMLKDVASKKW